MSTGLGAKRSQGPGGEEDATPIQGTKANFPELWVLLGRDRGGEETGRPLTESGESWDLNSGYGSGVTIVGSPCTMATVEGPRRSHSTWAGD